MRRRSTTKTAAHLAATGLFLLLSTSLPACDDGGSSFEEAAEEVKDEAEDAADEVKDEVDDHS